MNISRRTYLKKTALTSAACALPSMFISKSVTAAEVEPQPVPTEREAAAIERIAQETMESHNAPGLSVAISRHGQIVFQRGYGFADKTRGERVKPASRFRIASISKPITSVAIFSLIEQGRLRLSDFIFGAEGILKFDYGAAYPELVKKNYLAPLADAYRRRIGKQRQRPDVPQAGTESSDTHHLGIAETCLEQ